MQTSKKGYAEIAGAEGVSEKPYLDSADVWTIGIGITSHDGIKINKNTPPITIKKAFELFKEKLEPYEEEVNRLVKVKLTQEQFDALVSFQYNTGGLGNSTLLKYINAGKSAKNITTALMMWNKAKVNGKKVVLKGLTTRRAKEAKLFTEGEYSNDGYIDYITVNPKTYKPTYNKRIKIADYL